MSCFSDEHTTSFDAACLISGCAQVSGPLYKLVVTNLGGEKRFAAAVARRLQSLGALTRGDRRAAAGVDLSESNLDNPLGRKSLRCASALIPALLKYVRKILMNTHGGHGLPTRPCTSTGAESLQI